MTGYPTLRRGPDKESNEAQLCQDITSRFVSINQRSGKRPESVF